MNAPPDSGSALSNLIGLIYDTATDISLWPQLIEGMDSYLLESGIALPAFIRPEDGATNTPLSPPNRSISPTEESLLANLTPHFLRADEIHRQLATADEERNLLESIMDRLPLGMAIISEFGDLISMNRAFLALTQSTDLLEVTDGRLSSRPSDLLISALRQTMSDKPVDAALRLGDVDQGSSLTIWISRAASPGNTARSNRRAMILAASQSSRALSERGLAELFELSPAEARITQHLALGRTIEEAAAAQEISINTAKTHLKKIFAKFGVRRQPELIRAVYASPLWLDLSPALPPAVDKITPPTPRLRTSDEENHRLELPDGRALSYSDNGDHAGLPIILMHGIGGSRYLRHPDDSLLMEHGLRLIIPERPGSGDSTPLPGREISDWPEDIQALADHLGLQNFVVLGYSAGTPYALATAAALPERVKRIIIVSAMPPMESVEDIRNYTPTFRMSLMVARLTPSLLPPMMRVIVKGIERNVYRYIERSMEGATDCDREIFAHPRVRASCAIGLLAGIRRGEEDLMREIILIANDWGIDFGQLAQPIIFWHGSGDHLVSVDGAERFARRFPGSNFITIPKAGHYVIHSHWHDIVRQISASRPSLLSAS